MRVDSRQLRAMSATTSDLELHVVVEDLLFEIHERASVLTDEVEVRAVRERLRVVEKAVRNFRFIPPHVEQMRACFDLLVDVARLLEEQAEAPSGSEARRRLVEEGNSPGSRPR